MVAVDEVAEVRGPGDADADRQPDDARPQVAQALLEANPNPSSAEIRTPVTGASWRSWAATVAAVRDRPEGS